MTTQTYNTEVYYSIEKYASYLLSQKQYNENYQKVLFLGAIALFAGGLVSLYFDVTILTVILLAASIFFNQGASHYHLLNDMLDAQWPLALLISKHSNDLEMIRKEIKAGELLSI